MDHYNEVYNGSFIEGDPDDMPATERELAEDATWKKIQKNTFTRWCNEHLKCVNKRIATLEKDLSDGLRLIALLEVLSQKRCGKYNRRPNFRQMKLENVSVALNFIESEQIKLVSIDSKAIVDGNLKLILGLIWTLILHYSISMPMWDDDDENEERVQATPKQRLLGWIQNKIPEMPITNFKGNWQDGIALGALVDNCAPGLCPDWEDWNPSKGIENAAEAMKLADDYLGVPQVITPEEITNPEVDELSVMTYLSQFPKCQLKPNAPLRPKTNAKKARAYGKGVESKGCKVGQSAPFTIETVAAGQGEVKVTLKNPKGEKTILSATPNNDKLKTYSCVYYPTMPGQYEVEIIFAGVELSKSPYKVNVEDCPPDASKVVAKGPGLLPGNIVGTETYFDVIAEDAGNGELEIEIKMPSGKNLPVVIDEVSPGNYRVTYTPTCHGDHQIQVNFGGSNISNSPYLVPISLPFNPSRVWASGNGVEPEGLVTKQPARFVVHTEDAGDGKLTVKCIGPRGANEKVNVVKNDDGTYDCDYYPTKAGDYIITLSFGGKDAGSSPYRVKVDEAADARKVIVKGPGIEEGNIVGKETYFDVITKGAGKGDVKVTILKPGLTKGSPARKADFREEVTAEGVRIYYTPQEPTLHRVSVAFGGDEVNGSPYDVIVAPAYNARACYVKGRGVQATGNRVNEKTSFFVVVPESAGKAEVKVLITGPDGNKLPFSIKKISDETYEVEYEAKRVGNHNIQVTYGGDNVQKSPFQVKIGKAAGVQKVRAYGPGLYGGKVDLPAKFVVETTGEDAGQLGFSIVGPSQAKITCEDRGDGSCDVSYLPTEAGEYAVHVLCDDEDIKASPFMAEIRPRDQVTFPQKVKAYGPGLESGTPVNGKPISFTVDSRDAGKEAPLKVIVKADGKDVPCDISKDRNGMYTCSYKPISASKHTIVPYYDGVAINDSPYRVEVKEDSYPEKVKVYGPGIRSGLVAGEQTYFTVDCKQAGHGDVSIGIKCAAGVLSESESDVKFEIEKDEATDTFTVQYTPPTAGEYTIMALFADQKVPKAPFKVDVKPAHNAVLATASGPGLESREPQSGETTYFTVDARKAGKADLSVDFKPAGDSYRSPARNPEIIDNKDGTYRVEYTPHNKGSMEVEVKYGGDHISGSPFPVDVVPALKISEVKVKGLEKNLIVGKMKTFEVEHGEAGGKGKMKVAITSPSGKKVQIEEGVSPKSNKVSFLPLEEGPYQIDIEYDDKQVPGCPMTVECVLPTDPTKVKAYGSGLKEGIVDQPAPFTIETKGAGEGGIALTVEGPREAKIECNDNGDGSCDVVYFPTKQGEYQVNVLFAGTHVPGSPFTAVIAPNYDVTKLRFGGEGLEKATVGKPSEIIVDCSEAGEAPLAAKIVNPDGSEVKDVDVIDNEDGTKTVRYIPDNPGKAYVTMTYGDDKATDTPFEVTVKPDFDTKDCKCYGPGFEPEGILADVETEFTVDVSALAPTGGDHVHAKVVGPSGEPVPVELSDNGDGTYRARYTPLEKGPHQVEVDYEEVLLPECPRVTGVVEGCDPSRVKAYGPGLEKGTTNQAAKFTVDTRGAGSGGLGLSVEGPSDAQIACMDTKDGTCSVEYFPTAPGDYDVTITYGGSHINGSPFTVTVSDQVDPTKVECSGPGISGKVRANIPQEFTIDCTKAGVAPLEVAVKGPRGIEETVEVVDNGDGTHKAKFTPSKEGSYQVLVRYDGEEVPRCPFRLRVLPTYDASKVKCSGTGVGKTTLPATLPVQFQIDTRDAGDATVAVQITTPKREKSSVSMKSISNPKDRDEEGVLSKPFTNEDGNPTKAEIHDNEDGTFTVSYIPDEVGRYTVSVKYGEDEVPYSPYRMRSQPSGDAKKCIVSGDGIDNPILIDQEAVINVDTQAAGQGRLHCIVQSPSGELLKSEIVHNPNGQNTILFTPNQIGTHKVTVLFGGEEVPGSPFFIEVEDQFAQQEEQVLEQVIQVQKAIEVQKPNENVAVLDDDSLRPLDLQFEIPKTAGDLTSEVATPSGLKETPVIVDNGDGTISVQYQPHESGVHEMSIFHNSEHIAGSPIQFYADAIAPGHVTAYGPGLVTGKVGQDAQFTIVTKDAGAGGLSLAVEGPSKTEINCVENDDGTLSVTYLPTLPGEYVISVKFDDKDIPGSPFTANISGGNDVIKSNFSYGTTSDVDLQIYETDISLLTASIKAPSGREEDCVLKKLASGNIGISFTPKEVGTHWVSVFRRGRHIKMSPFKIVVNKSEIGDASLVKVYGEGIEQTYVEKTAKFMVDTRKAGYGGLGLSVEGPSKVDIHCEDLENGVCQVSYTPQVSGVYVVNVKFADEHVPDSPFHVQCSEDKQFRRESIMKEQKAATVAAVGSTCDLSLKIPDAELRNLHAEVVDPNKDIIEAEIIKSSEENSYNIRFIPKMMGTHMVNVKYFDKHVPGSPFMFTVGPLNEGGAHRVTAGGPGLEKAVVDTPAEFNIWTREAGAGGLSIAVEGPSKAEINFDDKKDGTCGVTYIVKQAGDYEVCVKFNDEHIPGSPFPVTATSAIESQQKIESDATKARAFGSGLRRARVGENAFTVDCTNAGSNMLLVGVLGPEVPIEEVTVKHLGQNRFNITYIASESGKYVLFVKWGEEHIPGSPFHVTVP